VDGTLAQYIGLALHGSAWLANRGGTLDVKADMSIFEHVFTADFDPLGGDRIATVADWLEALGGAGVNKIEIMLPTDAAGLTERRRQAGFVRDDRTEGLYVESADGPRLWWARWRTRVTSPAKRAPRRPWLVTYHETIAPALPERPDRLHAQETLLEAISTAIEFARAHELHPWDDVLAKAAALGRSEQPRPTYYPDMVPVDWLDLDRQRLLAMACTAHVFGGMGSWNDIGLPDDENTWLTYKVISDQLFAGVLRGISAVVNRRD
jgi:hypothetical protein